MCIRDRKRREDDGNYSKILKSNCIVPNFGTFLCPKRKERKEKMTYQEETEKKNYITFEELTKDIQMTEGEIFLSVDFTRGGEAEDDE